MNDRQRNQETKKNLPDSQKKFFLFAFGQYLRALLQRLNRFKSKLGNKTTDYLTVFSFTLCNRNAKLQLPTARDQGTTKCPSTQALLVGS